MRANKVINETKRFFLPNTLTVLVIAGQIGLLLIFSKLPPQIPLLYSQKWGEDRLVPPGYLWLLPTLCVLAVALTYTLVRMSPKDHLLQNLIFWTMPIFCILILITLANIVLISS